MFFYDAESIARELGPYGLAQVSEIDEPMHGGATLPFFVAVCKKT
jgi:hypothetical protein